MCLRKFTFINIGFQKKSKFSLLLKFNLHFFFKCRLFFFLLAYFCSEVIILTLFHVNILRPFFLIYLFNEILEIVQNTGYINGSFCYVVGYHLFISQSFLFAQYKLIRLAANILHSTFYKTFILRGHFFFLVNFPLQLSLYSGGYLR